MTIIRQVYTTTGSETTLNLGSYTAAKCVMIRWGYLSGDQTDIIQSGMAYADRTNQTGLLAKGAGSVGWRYHSGVNTGQEVVRILDTSTTWGDFTYEVKATLSLSATQVTLVFSIATVGHKLEIIVWDGSSIEAEIFSQNLSPVAVGFQPTLVIASSGTLVNDEDHTSDVPVMKHGYSTGPTVVQYGINFHCETMWGRASNDHIIIDRFDGVNERTQILTYTSTGFTFSENLGTYHVQGLAIKGDDALLTSHLVAATLVTNDEEDLPDAGFLPDCMLTLGGIGVWGSGGNTVSAHIGSAHGVGNENSFAWKMKSDSLRETDMNTALLTEQSNFVTATFRETQGTLITYAQVPRIKWTFVDTGTIDRDLAILYLDGGAAPPARRRLRAVI